MLKGYVARERLGTPDLKRFIGKGQGSKRKFILLQKSSGA